MSSANEPPADWYVAALLDAAADRLEALDPVGTDRPGADLLRRLRDASTELRRAGR